MAGVVLLIGTALSVQLGSALGTSVIPAVGVLGVVLARYVVQASIHIPLAWKHLRALPPRRWLWGLLMAIPLLTMNTAIYVAFSHIGVGLSVTIELLGPIVLAVLLARTRGGWLGAGLAAVGMLLVTGPSGTATPVGVFWAGLAATSWALYLLALRKAGRELPGLTPTAIAGIVGLTVLIPVNLVVTRDVDWSPSLLLLLLVVGLLSSALPYAFDLMALRRVPIQVASTMQSIHPVMAVLWGAVILGERLGWAELAGLVIISTANVLAVRSAAERPHR